MKDADVQVRVVGHSVTIDSEGSDVEVLNATLSVLAVAALKVGLGSSVTLKRAGGMTIDLSPLPDSIPLSPAPDASGSPADATDASQALPRSDSSDQGAVT